MEKIFFTGWESLWRTFIICILAYISIVFLLRISGKRTLSKMNAFDLIVTIALGSTLATVVLNKSVSLADGFLAFALLIFLQFIITWLSVRSQFVSKLVKSEPSLLVYRGKLLEDALKKERVTKDEILAAIREKGAEALASVDAAVIETDGTISIIIISGEERKMEVLKDVKKEKGTSGVPAGIIND